MPLRADGATYTNAASSSASITLPAAWQVGDYAVVAITRYATTTITPPSGWTLLVNKNTGTSSLNVWYYYKTLVAGEPGSSITWGFSSGNRTSIIAFAVYSATYSQLVNVASGTGTTVVVPAVTVAETSEIIIGVHTLAPSPGTWTDDAALTFTGIDAKVNEATNGLDSRLLRLTANPVAAGTYGTWTETNTVAATKSWGVPLAFTTSGGGEPTVAWAYHVTQG